jgi:predicted membrane metal-binding protein
MHEQSLLAETPPAFGDDLVFERRWRLVRRVVWIGAGLWLALYAMQQFERSGLWGVASARALAVYGGVLLWIRLAGKRTLGEMSAFDLVILIILSEAVQAAMTQDDSSIASALAIVGTLVGIDVVLAFVKHRVPPASKWLDDVPTVLVR